MALRMTLLEIVNGENQGGYHQVGLEGTGRFTLCSAEDDFFNAFGDPDETLVATALNWLGEGACPTSQTSAAWTTLASERQGGASWSHAEYIPERVDEYRR